MELKDLKKEYHKLEVKHRLPRFEDLNESFEIEKVERESEILLRVIRKIMMEKIMNTLSFIEMLMNPMNAPRMYLPFLKNLSIEDKKRLDKLYMDFSEMVVAGLEIEIDYSEKGEAEMICKINKLWKDSRGDLKKILKGIKKPNSLERKEKSYFG